MKLSNLTLLPELFVTLPLDEQQAQFELLGYWTHLPIVYFSREVNSFAAVLTCPPNEGTRRAFFTATHCSGPINVRAPYLDLYWDPGQEDDLIWAGPESNRTTYSINDLYRKKINRLDCQQLGSVSYKKIIYFTANRHHSYTVPLPL
jgi:hypothetical protein